LMASDDPSDARSGRLERIRLSWISRWLFILIWVVLLIVFHHLIYL
jgi:hypothetical protein